MTLPKNPTLTWLLSFWCSANVVLALLVGMTGALSGWPASSIVLLVGLVVVAAGGALRLRVAAAAYRQWNRLASRYSALVRASLIGASFAVVTSAASLRRPRGRSRMDPLHASWERKTDGLHSSWERKRSSGIDTEERLGTTFAWISRYVAWSRGSDNVWSLCLLPFVLLLLALETNEDGGVPERLYTLY